MVDDLASQHRGTEHSRLHPVPHARGVEGLRDTGSNDPRRRQGYYMHGLKRDRLVLPIHDGERVILAFMKLEFKGGPPDILFPEVFQVPVPFQTILRIYLLAEDRPD